MIRLPDPRTKLWNQDNQSDVLGTLWSSFNLNLTEQLGKTRISHRMVITTNGISQLGTPVSFREYAGDLYACSPTSASSTAGLFIASGGKMNTAFSVLGATGAGATTFSCDYSDMEIFSNKIVITGDLAAFLYGDGSTFTKVDSVLTSSVNHKLLNFLKTNRLYIASGLRQIISCDTGFSVASSSTNTLNLGNYNGQVFITSMIQDADFIWVLTLNQYNQPGYVYVWDGVTADTVSNILPLDCRGALAGILKDGVPYIIDVEGKLQYFNGKTFVLAPYGRLPVSKNKYLKNPISVKNDRFIHPNGITLVDNRINILINNENYDNTKTIQESLPSGIWEYDPSIGWYHKYGLTQYDLNGAASILDFGQNRVSRVGALTNFKKDDNTSSSFVGTFLAGADYFTNATLTKSATFTNDSLNLIQKYGYLVTTKIMSSSVQDTYDNLYMRLRPLLNTTDKVWVKWRPTDSPFFETTGTWINQNSFTITTSSNQNSYTQGNEVEITQGNGSGWCANITSITNNGDGTSTVVLEDQFPGGAVSGTALFRFQTWQKAGSFSDQKSLATFTPKSGSQPWIQLKICFLFTGANEMIDVILDNSQFQ